MKALKVAIPILVVILIIVAFIAPIGPLPGFRIGGVKSPTPSNWGDTSQTHEIRLKVPGSIPRVVIIWVIQHEGELFVVGNSSSGWVKMLGKGGPVSMRMGEKTYNLNASQVMSGWGPIMESYADKYRPDYPDIVNGFPKVEDAAGAISVFRLGT